MPVHSKNEDGFPMTRVSLLDYVVIIAKYRRFIIRFVLGGILIIGVPLFTLVPRWYKSTAVILPPRQANPFNLASSLSRATAPLRSLGLGGGSDDLSQLQAILASRRVLEGTVRTFDLQTVYGVDSLQQAIDRLAENVEVGLGKEDVSLEISAFDTDRNRAAAIANSLVQELNTVHRELSVREAKSNREFLQRRYEQNKKDLEQAQEVYKQFQLAYGVYSIPDQIRGAITVAAELQTHIVMAEVELGILERTTSPSNALYKQKALELDQLRSQMANIIQGTDSTGQAETVFPPFRETPEIGSRYLNLFREIEIQGQIMELLIPLYEQAKIEEQRNTPSVLMLDEAVPASRPSRPKRLIIVVVAFLALVVIAFLSVVVKETLARKRSENDDGEAQKLDFVRRELHWRNLLR